MSKETGGPAFPVPIAGDTAGFVDAEECGVSTGLTLRDYFAAKAMAGDMASEAMMHRTSDESLIKIAEFYYRMADAMLRVRNPEYVETKPEPSGSCSAPSMPF